MDTDKLYHIIKSVCKYIINPIQKKKKKKKISMHFILYEFHFWSCNKKEHKKFLKSTLLQKIWDHALKKRLHYKIAVCFCHVAVSRLVWPNSSLAEYGHVFSQKLQKISHAWLFFNMIVFHLRKMLVLSLTSSEYFANTWKCWHLKLIKPWDILANYQMFHQDQL